VLVLQMLMDLGPNVYVEDFERHFLAQASEFYRKEAQEFISSSDCPDYLRKAEKRLSEEMERVKNYLDVQTEPRITKVVEIELIREQVS
jgi:cullin 3